ncbi:MAG: GNAT family N-acetyltransferase [Actinomycetota bacterium]|nr:GNAT family N-acetyltransferase [Actinomycetota bacterium]
MLRPEYPIMTDRLILRPFVDDDLDVLYSIQSRPDVARFLYWEPRTREEVAVALRGRLAMTKIEHECDTILLAVTRAADGVLLGDVNLRWTTEDHRGGEIGFVFHPDHQGHGYAREAAAEMLRLGFEELALHRVIGRLDAANTASARLLSRLGMRLEGTFRQNEWVKGEWADESVYAILWHEWREMRLAD